MGLFGKIIIPYLTNKVACAYQVLFTINNISLCFKSLGFGRFQGILSVIKILKRHYCMRWKQLTMCSRCTVSETDNIINGTSRQFYVHVTVHHNKFLYNKTNRCTNFPNLLWLKMNLYMFRAVSLPIIRNSCTVHLALVYVIQV